MQHLRLRRSRSAIFAGRHGLITPRDLFRWAARGAVSYQDLALNGYLLLAERLRSTDECSVVKEVFIFIKRWPLFSLL
jgi:midasin